MRRIPEPLTLYRLHAGQVSSDRVFMAQQRLRAVVDVLTTEPGALVCTGWWFRARRMSGLRRRVGYELWRAGRRRECLLTLASAWARFPLDPHHLVGLLDLGAPRLAASARWYLKRIFGLEDLAWT
ncbi:hypothetical protein [Deferrisoma camini]|uniref:hypothetical protein n=1 Tax=Deferrisoma camini TaxID=1035120 RepID=UPI0004BC36DA|nr:hypothetical protein [Deferrisoma camini]